MILQFFSLIYEKKFKVFSKKRSPDSLYLSSIKTKLAINFLKKNFALGRKKDWSSKG